MISIKEIKQKDIALCIELDLDTISLWNKNQWNNELKKEGIKVFGLSLSNLIIGICVLQVVIDEVQLNYFTVREKYRRKGFGSYLMNYSIKYCEKLKITKILLEVSESNLIAEKFYSHFNFSTVGHRKKYYKDGSNALLKEKKIIKNK